MKKIILIVFCLLSVKAYAAPGDTTWITAINQEFHNWADIHYTNVALPDTGRHFQKILMTYTIGCPAAGCDPYDRFAWIRLYQDTISNIFEIARMITPFNIVGGGYPGTCTFNFDVTDYMPILHDTVKLGSFIETYINGTHGWLVTVKFAFIEGELEYKPFKIINLWRNDYIVYGDTANPPENYLQPRSVFIDPQTVIVKARSFTTGHGQGNTGNAAEFSPKQHSFVVNGDTASHSLWRLQCSSNPCSPQGGTWQFSRTGWCPGSGVIPWDVDFTSSVIPGQNSTVDYTIEAYTNFCRPTNPNCINGVTCADCNYNSTGHTEPNWKVSCQLILYKHVNVIGIHGISNSTPSSFSLAQNYPNPFNPSTKINFAIEVNTHVRIVVYDIRGKAVVTLVDRDMHSGDYSFDFDGTNLPSGIYYYKMEAKNFSDVKKMALIK